MDTVILGEPILSLGLRCCPAVDAVFKMAEAVPLGKPGGGDVLFQKAASGLYAAAAAISVGIMKGAFDEGLRYAKDREQGGRRIAQWSEIQMMLANMAVQMKIADMLVSEACRVVDGEEMGWEQKALSAVIHIHGRSWVLLSGARCYFAIRNDSRKRGAADGWVQGRDLEAQHEIAYPTG